MTTLNQKQPKTEGLRMLFPSGPVVAPLARGELTPTPRIPYLQVEGPGELLVYWSLAVLCRISFSALSREILSRQP